MNNFEKILCVAILVAGIVGYVVLQPKTNTLGGATFAGTTVSTSSVNATLKQIVTASGGRRFIQIQNHGTVPLYCLLEDSTTAASSSVTSTAANPIGFIVATSGAATVGRYVVENYSGVINCTASAAASTTIITSP